MSRAFFHAVVVGIFSNLLSGTPFLNIFEPHLLVNRATEKGRQPRTPRRKNWRSCLRCRDGGTARRVLGLWHRQNRHLHGWLGPQQRCLEELQELRYFEVAKILHILGCSIFLVMSFCVFSIF